MAEEIWRDCDAEFCYLENITTETCSKKHTLHAFSTLMFCCLLLVVAAGLAGDAGAFGPIPGHCNAVVVSGVVCVSEMQQIIFPLEAHGLPAVGPKHLVHQDDISLLTHSPTLARFWATPPLWSQAPCPWSQAHSTILLKIYLTIWGKLRS